jgi:hypothetical protein
MALSTGMSKNGCHYESFAIQTMSYIQDLKKIKMFQEQNISLNLNQSLTHTYVNCDANRHPWCHHLGPKHTSRIVFPRLK